MSSIWELNYDDVLERINGAMVSDEDSPYGVTLTHVVDVMLKLQKAKEEGYGYSWCKRGMPGIWANTSRKYDRLDNMLASHFNDGVPLDRGENIVSTIADMAIYGIMWVAWFAKYHPELYDAWEDEINEFLGSQDDSS